MSSIKVHFEIGHETSPKTKKTPEGFTHDWECFVRGQEGADISHFVEKVVFHLHDTFPKPRRVVKEPPFSIKESGYAGFVFPIEIYLKNKDEPKKITFQYDLSFIANGSLKDRYIFPNPNEEFKRKLLKGGGIPVNNSFYTNHDQESRSRDSSTDEKQQLVSKPKLSSDSVKKHKTKEVKEEPSYKTTCFEKLFGAPLQKPPKISPEPKKTEKSVNNSVKSEKKDKERSSSDKKSKHEYKEIKTEKTKVKEEKDKQKFKDVKSITKEQEKPKERANKRHSDRPISPDPPKKKCVSPSRKPPSPAPRSSNSSSMKEASKHTSDSFDQKKIKTEDKSTDLKTQKESKEKKKKEKKSHDRDKERKDKTENKKDSHKSKDSPKDPKETPKPKEPVKKEEPAKESPIKEKQSKPEKVVNKFSLENLSVTPPNNKDINKYKDKGELEKKHKHKKKDKRRDESKDKHKESSKERKHKHDKIREIPNEKSEVLEQREIIIPKERSVPDPISPISIDTASQCSSKSGLTKPIYMGPEEINSSHSESESFVIIDEDIKMKVGNISPELVKLEPSPEPEPDVEHVPVIEPEVEPSQILTKEKSKKHKDKSKREEKRRKRKIAEGEESENRKIAKRADSGPCNNDDTEHGESSGSITIETKVQDNGVSSSLGEDAEPGDLSPDYMVQLRGLQQRIMMIKNNEDLERVVNLIAETGRYEVTTQTFDFDLCLLDRSTVQQLIQLVGC